MNKNIFISGVLGGVVMFVAMSAGRFFLQGIGYSGFRTMPDQVQIHAALKERITEPGTYVCPYMLPGESNSFFPDYLNQPIFEVTYKGYTHATVPGFASAGMLAFLLAPIVAAWLLSQASERVMASYFRRAVYVAILGLFVAVSADLVRALAEDQPLLAVMATALVSMATWAAVGLVLAWKIKPA